MNKKGKATKTQTLMYILVFGLLGIGFLTWWSWTHPQSATVIQTGGGGGQLQVGAYVPFPLSQLNVYVKDSYSKSLISSATLQAKVFDASVPDVANPLAPYVDSDSSLNSGQFNFVAKKIMTGTRYKLKIWDSASSPTYYPVLIDFEVPQLDPNLGANAQYTLDDVFLDKIGTFGTMYGTCTGAGGASLPTGVSYSSGVVTINKTAATDTNIIIRCPVAFSNTASASKIKDAVFQFYNDPSNPVDKSAITSATLTYNTGTNFDLPSDILNFISSETPIPIKSELTASDSGNYYLQLTINKDTLSSGDTWYFKEDDLGKYLGTEPVANQYGASPQSLKFTVVT